MAKVTGLPVHQGRSGWNEIIDSRQASAPLEGAITADWLVIGAGFAGLTAAWRLSKIAPGDKIVVIEAGDLASGACGRNSGFMIDLPHDLSKQEYGGSKDHDLLQIRLNRAGITFAKDIAQEFGMPSGVLNPCGKVNAACSDVGETNNRNYGAHLNTLGETSEWLDAHTMQEMTGTGFYRSGLFTPGTVVIQPADYIRRLALGLDDNVTIFENSPALSWNRQGNSWSVQTPKGRISAPKIILATNGHVQNFGFFKSRLMHVFTFASMTKALTKNQKKALGGRPNWGVTPAHPYGATVRKISGANGDRIVLRTRFSFNPSMRVSGGALKRAGHKLSKHFSKRFPMLRDVEMQYQWAGHLCISLNGVQAVGEVDRGIYSAVCQNGLGTARGSLSGASAAELAAGCPSNNAQILADMPAPKRLPPAPFAAIGANATMMWNEWRAGLE